MVYVLSPYITSKTAEDVLEDVEICEIYTVSDIENFINGSSSIETLKNLIQKGYSVYFIPKLHAKIILIVDRFVSIGSQNLTNQGTQNKEATFTSTSLDVVRFVASELENWFAEREEVSLELLEDLEDRIAHLKDLYDDFRDEVEKVEEEIEVEKTEKNDIKEKLKRLKANLAKIEKTQEYVKGSIKLLNNSWTFASASSFGSNLLNWQIDSEKIELVKTNRYLTLIQDNGKLCWARVMTGRITFYQPSVLWAGYTLLDGKYYKATFEANWDLNILSDYNLSVRLDNALISREYGIILLWFDSKKLEIADMQFESRGTLGDWMEENFDSFKDIILQKLISPFKFSKNLTGVKANEFFDKTKYELRLGKIKNNPILLFSEI